MCSNSLTNVPESTKHNCLIFSSGRMLRIHQLKIARYPAGHRQDFKFFIRGNTFSVFIPKVVTLNKRQFIQGQRQRYSPTNPVLLIIFFSIQAETEPHKTRKLGLLLNCISHAFFSLPKKSGSLLPIQEISSSKITIFPFPGMPGQYRKQVAPIVALDSC